MYRRLAVAIALPLLLIPAASALADTVWLRSGQATNALERPNVKVEKIENGVLFFRSEASDRVTERVVDEVARISADGETVFNQAEEAFFTGKWDQAAAGYQRAISSSARQWVKDRSGLRLVAAAEKSGKFPVAVTAWLALMSRDPAQAAKQKPQVPANAAAGSLTSSVTEVERTLNSARLSEEQRETLLAFQMELARANGDLKKAQSIGARRGNREAAPMPAVPGGQGGGGNAGAGAAPAAGPNASLALQMAKLALDQKQFEQALKEIDAAAATITDPEQQVEALYTVAEARSAMAKDEPAAMKDAALAYMRVVARAKAARVSSPRVPEALLKTAILQEKLNATQEALLLYQQVADEFKGTEAATRAAQAADRLGKASNKPNTAASAG